MNANQNVLEAVCTERIATRQGILQKLFAVWFDAFVYNQIWEDPRVDLQALRLNGNSRVLTISSGGCNALNYLIENPESITAVDLNRYHIYLLRLKLSALKFLPTHEDFFGFYGFGKDAKNVVNYHEYIAPNLSEETREFWEGNGFFGKLFYGERIAANLEINEQIPNNSAPVSMEWTVPFECAFLHVGVHNLPPGRAFELTDQLLDYTSKNPDNEKLHEIFALLDELPEVLIVLNHPVWDIEMIGGERHSALLKSFIAEHGKWIHAFEINGFRSWSENKTVIEMAETLGFPLVTGGDRHCCHTNTVINLTNAKTFAEFAEEIRVDKYSEVVLMPEYREPLNFRQIASIAQILKNYPEFPVGRQRWFDRVHIDAEDDSGLRPLSDHWKGGGPQWLRWALRAVGVLRHKSVRPAFRLAMKRADAVPKQSKVLEQTLQIVSEPLPMES